MASGAELQDCGRRNFWYVFRRDQRPREPDHSRQSHAFRRQYLRRHHGVRSGAGPIVNDITGFGSSLLSFSNGGFQSTNSLSLTNAWAINTGQTAYLSAGTNSLQFSASLSLPAGTESIHTTSVTLTGSIAGPGTLGFSGSGLVTLPGSNAYTGGTTISSGTLVTGNNASLGTGSLNIGTGTMVQLLSGSPSIGGINGGGSLVLGNSNTSSPQSLIITGSGAYTGRISESVSGSILIKRHRLADLGRQQQLHGGTIVSAGTLASSTQSSLGTGTILLSGGAL